MASSAALWGLVDVGDLHATQQVHGTRELMHGYAVGCNNGHSDHLAGVDMLVNDTYYVPV